MRDSGIVRLVGEQLFWYPPGRGDAPVSLEHESDQEQLQQVLQARRSPVIFAVPGSEVRLQQVDVPANERRHIASSLPYLLEEEFASDIDELHIASVPLGGDVLAVGSTEHERVQYWQSVLADLSGINQWVPEPLLLPWREGEVSLVVENDQVLVRYGECEGFCAEPEMLPIMLEAIAANDDRTVVIYGSDQASDMELVPAALRDRTQWRNGGFGAALLLSAEPDKQLNLLQGEYGPRLPLKRWWMLWRWPLAALAAAFFVQLVWTYSDYSRLQGENLQLRQAMEAAYRQAVPRGAIADPERQLSRKLNELRGGGGAVALVPVLEKVGRVVQAEKGARISTINFSGRSGDLRMNLLVPSFKAVERIRTALNAAGLKASVENSNAQGDEVRARIKVEAASP